MQVCDTEFESGLTALSSRFHMLLFCSHRKYGVDLMGALVVFLYFIYPWLKTDIGDLP